MPPDRTLGKPAGASSFEKTSAIKHRQVNGYTRVRWDGPHTSTTQQMRATAFLIAHTLQTRSAGGDLGGQLEHFQDTFRGVNSTTISEMKTDTNRLKHTPLLVYTDCTLYGYLRCCSALSIVLLRRRLTTLQSFTSVLARD